MRHKCLVQTVKKWLKSVYIYGSYRKIKTGVSLFWTTRYIANTKVSARQLWHIGHKSQKQSATLPSLTCGSIFIRLAVFASQNAK